MRRLAVLAAVAAVWMVVTAFPSVGADNGTLSATMATPAPCMTLDTTTVDFGTHPFITDDGDPSTVPDASATAQVVISDCSTVLQDVSVSGTNANSTTSEVVWSLTDSSDPCIAGLDKFRAHAGFVLSGGSFQNLLPGVFRGIGPLFADSARTADLALWMPCQGSSGQGEAMAFNINILVTIP